MRLHIISCLCLVATVSGSNGFCMEEVSPRAAVQEDFQLLMETNSCPSCNLAGATLIRVDLSEADLEGANLAGAQLNLADLSGANLKNANLQGASLGGTDLAGADLRGANLTGAVLEGAYLVGAQMDGEIVTRRPYEAEGGPPAGETVFVDDEKHSKNVPFTNQAFVEDRPAIKENVPVNETTGAEVKGDVGPTPEFTDTATLNEPADIATPEEPVEVAALVDPEPVAVQEEVLTENAQVPENSKKLVMIADAVLPEDPPGAGRTKTDTPPEVAAPTMESVAEPVVEQPPVDTRENLPPVSDQDREEEGSRASAVEEQESGEIAVIPDVELKTVGSNEETLENDAGVPDVSQESADTRKTVPQPAEPVQQKLGDNVVVAQLAREHIQDADQLPEEIVEDKAVSEAVAAESEEVKSIPEEPEQMTIENTASVADTQPAARETVQEEEVVAAAENNPAPVPDREVVYTVETPAAALEAKKELVEFLLDENRCVGCDLSGMDLSGRDLDEADLERANLQGANLSKAGLQEANLKGADLSGANLRDADLREADLYRANLSGSDLTGARFEKALMDSVNVSGTVGANFEGAFRDE